MVDECFKLLVTATTNEDNGLRAPAITSQVLSFTSYENAEEAFSALKQQGPKSATYLSVWRCYELKEEIDK